MKIREIRRQAYEYAAGWLERDCDSNDIDESATTEEEETAIREFIRVQIVGELKKKAGVK